MIQRIQSIFLLLAGIAFFALFGLPLASSNVKAGFFADTIFNVQDHVALMVLAALGGILSIATIFLFKNRPLQIKLGYLIIVLGIAIPVVASILALGTDDVKQETIRLSLGVGAPILAIIFGILAIRFIGKDNKLVRSMDRLR